ncbi:hypothetical protein AC629_27010 [Bradyrhizobium sp. NAS80.1]|nr:hypothetical protein AC629_27010 [Bradyrhizobium sp. NAS80.1]
MERAKGIEPSYAAWENDSCINNDEHFAKTVVAWRDAKTVGLTIRIIPGKPVWHVRKQETTLDT